MKIEIIENNNKKKKLYQVPCGSIVYVNYAGKGRYMMVTDNRKTEEDVEIYCVCVEVESGLTANVYGETECEVVNAKMIIER